MTRTIVRGSTVVANGEIGVIEDGALVVEDGVVVDVGPRERIEGRGPFDAELGGPDRIIIPGFVNGHYHTECWTAPGLIDSIFEMGNLYMGSGLIDTDEEIIQLLATYGLIHAAKGGQTTLVDTFYGRPWIPHLGADAALRAYEEVGLRVALGVTLRDQNRYTHEDDERFLSKLSAEVAAEVRASPLGYAWPVDDMFGVFDSLTRQWDGRHGRTRIILAPDWTPVVSDDLYARSARVAADYGTTLTTHALETRSELMWNVEHVGTSAMRRLDDLGVLGPTTSLAHFVWATDEDLDVVAGTGAVAIHCPGSNLRGASGICRVKDIMRSGGLVSLGTDGCSVGDNEDFFEELRLGAYLQRTTDDFTDHRIDSESLIRNATEVGAGPAGFAGRVGALVPGFEADLLCVRKDRIFFPRSRYSNASELDVLLDRANASDIEFVMVGGDIVVRDGVVLGVDEGRLRDRISELADRLYRPTTEADRRRELAAMMTPHIERLAQRWYSAPIDDPATPMNTRSAPRPPDGD